MIERPHRLILAALFAASGLTATQTDAQVGLHTPGGETKLIVPLGVPNPKDFDARLAAAPACTSPLDPDCRENISLAAFRVEVNLPAGVAATLAEHGRVLSVAIESERVEGAPVPQSLANLPRAHLRMSSRNGTPDPRAVRIPLGNPFPLPAAPEDRFQEGSNVFVSPWIVAVADPRASIGYPWPAGADKEAAGCVRCERPLHLRGASETDGVFEIYTAGRFLTVRAEAGIFEGTPYAWLGEAGRFEWRIRTVMADTVRPTSVRHAAQGAPMAQGLIQETLYLDSGELATSSLDLDAGGRAGWNVHFSREYRSRTIGGGAIGAGWGSPVFARLRPLPDGNVELRDGAGDIWLFTLGSEGRYQAPPGLFLRLARTADGWLLTDQQWRITAFDRHGRLESEADVWHHPAKHGSGNTIRYVYGADGLLAQIVDPVMRATSLTWYGSGTGAKEGLLRTVTDWRGRRIDYDYDSRGRLIEVALPSVENTSGARPVVRYGYDGTSSRLASITDPADPPARVTFNYADERLTRENWATGESVSVAYVVANIVEVTDALGQLRRYTLTPDRARIATLEEIAVPVSAAPFGSLPASLDPEPPAQLSQTRRTSWTYDAHGLATQEVLGGVRETSLAWKSVESAAAPGFVLDKSETSSLAAAKGLTPSADAPLTRQFQYQEGANAATFLRGVSANGLGIDSPEPHRNTPEPATSNDSVDIVSKYSADGLPTHVTSSGGTDAEGGGASVVITYESATSPLLHARALPRTIDRAGLLTRIDYPDADTIRETDPRGIVTETKLDSRRRPVSVTMSGGELTLHDELLYDASGRLKTHRRRQGGATVTTTNDYDAMNRLIASRTDNVAVSGALTSIETTVAYDIANRKIVTTHPGGAVTTLTLDTLGRTSSSETATGSSPVEVIFQYDIDGNLVYESDGQMATARAFDAHGRMIAALAPDLTRVVMEHDAWGRPVRITRFGSDGSVIGDDSFGFTAAGRLEAIQSRIDETQTRRSSLAWDGGGRTSAVETSGRASRARFEASGRMLAASAGAGTLDAITDAFQSIDVDSHADILPIRSRIRERSDIAEYTSIAAYNTAGDPVVATLGHLDWEQGFDEAGHLVRFKEPALGEATFAVDARGALLEERMPDGASNEYAYTASGAESRYDDPAHEETLTTSDLAGRPLTRAYADGTNQTFEWDGPRLRSVIDRQGRSRVLHYNLRGQLTNIDDLGGAKLEAFEYDAAGRVTRWKTADAVLSFERFNMDSRPGRTVQTRCRNGSGISGCEVLDQYAQEHEWNEHGERTGFTMPAAPEGWTARVDLSYDATGNLNVIERQIAGETGRDVLMHAWFRGAGRPESRTVIPIRVSSEEAAIERKYAYDEASSLLHAMRVTAGGVTLAGSELTREGFRIATASELGVAGEPRMRRWSYDARGRLASSEAGKRSTETMTAADFRSGVGRELFFGGPVREALAAAGIAVDQIDPPSESWSEAPGHKIASFTFNGAERIEDGRNRYTFDARGRMVIAEQKSGSYRTLFSYDGMNRIVGRRIERRDGAGWALAGAAETGDGMPGEVSFVWDPVSDTILAVYDTSGTLLRQIIHGGLGYDDPIEVTVLPRSAVILSEAKDLTPEARASILHRLYPVYDEAAAGSLELVINEAGAVVSRHGASDPYGEGAFSVAGAAVERVAVRAQKSGGGISEIEVTITLSEAVAPDTVNAGARLASLDAPGALVAVFHRAPALKSASTLAWTLTEEEWTALTASPAETLSVAVTSSLRATAWAEDLPVLPPPDWARVTKPVYTSASHPVEVRETLASLASWLAGIGESEESTTTLYETPALALAGTPGPSEASRLLVAAPFHAYPYQDPISGLIYARERWYDPETGVFLTPDPMEYRDSSNMYAFCGGDPINCSDPTGTEGYWRDAGKTLLGYSKGVGQVVAAPGVLTYNLTGALLYKTTGGEQYRNQFETTSLMGAALRHAAQSPGNARDLIVHGVTAGIDQMVECANRGDAGCTGEGLGNLISQTLLVAATGGTTSMTTAPARAFATSTGTVVRTGGNALAFTSPNAGVVSPILLANAVNVSNASDRGRASTDKGRHGEECVSCEIGVSRNTGSGRVTVPGTGRGGYRVPDFDPAITVTLRGSVVEVKNVKNLSMTPQLRDLVKYAESRQAVLEIFTNARLPQSGELAGLVSQRRVIIRPIQ